MANRGSLEAMKDFIFLGSKVTADGECSHEIKISIHTLMIYVVF